MEPQIRYVRSADGTNIAYSVVGSGRPLVYVGSPTTVLTLETDWHIARARRGIERLAAGRTVVRTDARGRGLSDHEATDQSLDAHVDDIRCVVEALSQESVDLLGDTSSPVAIAYAARYPERVRKMVLTSAIARGRDRHLSPARRSLAEIANVDFDFFKQATALLNLGWVEGRAAAEAMRHMTLEELTAGWQAMRQFDASGDLPVVRCPVLVLYNRSRDEYTPFAAARHVVSSMQNAVLRVIDSETPTTVFDEAGLVVDLIAEFLDRDDAAADGAALPSGTAIILFADIVDSTALTERMGDGAFRAKARDLDGALRSIIADAGGTTIDAKTLGDGVLATFPAASQAIDAALAFEGAAVATQLQLHVGLHAGDVIREANNVFGGAVNIAARISALSAPGDILVSATVRDLARTSASVVFEDRGEHALKGVADPQRVFAVRKKAEG
jgi:class 3 adenylate cyclase